MGAKKIRKVANQLREVANAEGIRIGLIILEDGNKAMGFSSYKGKEDARFGLEVLKDILTEMGGEE